MAAICQSLRFLKLPNPNAKCVPSCRAAGAGPPPWNSANLVVQACSTRYKLVTRLLKVRTVTFSSDSSRKWTAVWLVGEDLDRSWQTARSCWWMLGSLFRISILVEGNNPPLQIRSFGGNRGKCNRTRDSTEPLFSAVLMRQDLLVADSSYLQWNEAYEHSLSLSSHLFLVPCYEGEPNERHFFADMFIKRWFC